ncbi:MAG: arylsulfatase [Fuerstiella sp.]
MTTRNLLNCFSILTLAFFAANTKAEESLPNVIVILADDMGLDSVARFNSKLNLKTPAIDRLAADGMSFQDAHSTSAVCSPTRYSVLTGRYNWRSRLKKGIVGKWERPLFEDQRVTIAEMFQSKDYQTACIGKWHLGWNWPKEGGGFTTKSNEIDFTKPIKGGPNDHGFEYYFGDDVPNWPPFAWRENDRILGNITTTMKAGAMVGVSAGPAVEDWDFRAVLSEYSKRWHRYIVEQADESKPFFLYASMPSPHTPIAPHQDFQGRSGISEYADFLIQTDAAVSRILDALEQTNQAKDTLIFFTCDNGTSPKANFEQLKENGVHLNENWRGWKADAYEGGHRVPFVVRWPGQIKAGSVSNETITLTDIMATCADVLDYPLPSTCAEDSVSLWPTLQGKAVEKPLHEVVVHQSGLGYFAVRKGPWKLLLCHGSGGWSDPREPAAIKRNLPPVQLFHMTDDSKEANNLHAQHPEIVRELTADLKSLVEAGRSTVGDIQPNHDHQTWWPGLPWPRSTSKAPVE